MLMQSKHLMPQENKKEPFYIVAEAYKNISDESFYLDDWKYVENYGIQKFPTSIDDSIIEMSPNLCDAIMFCNKEDAEKVAMRCTFKCNCGCVNKVGKLIEVRRSNRKEEGVTYGHIKSWYEDIEAKKNELLDKYTPLE